MTGALTNWARNVVFGAERLHRPTSLDELRRLVAGSARIRALGTGHSFNRIADTPGDLVSVCDLPPVLLLDRERSTVTVSAGTRYGELAARLQGEGYALHNLGSLAHTSVAGAVQTGTHGSGTGNGSLATAVCGLEMVAADGSLVVLDRERDFHIFDGAVVALGALGIVTGLTLEVEPTFDVRQYVYEGLAWDVVAEHFAELSGDAYSVSMFTDWRSADFGQVWLKRRVDRDEAWPSPPRRWYGATPADAHRHPLPQMSSANCTPQLGVPGPWNERLPHFRLDFTPSSGEELQSEYFVPREQAVAALTAIGRVRERVAGVLQVCEVRSVAADRLWLSPAEGRDTVALHFTWVKDPEGVMSVLPVLEEQLAPFGARPHWGKLSRTAPDVVRRLYPRIDDFTALTRRFDPEGAFRNELLDTYLL